MDDRVDGGGGVDIVTPESAAEARTELADLLDRGCLVEVTTDLDRYGVGRVDAVTDAHVRLRVVDAWGRPDGIVVRSLEDVTAILTGTPFLERRIGRLERLSPAAPPAQRLVGGGFDLVRDALRLSLEDRTIVTMRTSAWRVAGSVAKLSVGAGTVLQIDECGDPGVERPFGIADVAAVDFGGEEQRILQTLHGLGAGAATRTVKC